MRDECVESYLANHYYYYYLLLDNYRAILNVSPCIISTPDRSRQPPLLPFFVTSTRFPHHKEMINLCINLPPVDPPTEMTSNPTRFYSK